MTDYSLGCFFDIYEEWVEREDPSVAWRERILDWIEDLVGYVFDTAVLAKWHGFCAWSAKIDLEGDDERVVVCVYDIYPKTKVVTCRTFRFAPYYEMDEATPFALDDGADDDEDLEG